MHSRLVLWRQPVSSCVHQFHANGYICTGKLHVKIPNWLGSYHRIWYVSRIHDSIYNRAAKYISFSADESASQCVGSTADLASRYRTSFTTSGYTSISAFAGKPKQCIGPMADTSTTESGDDTAAQVSYRSSGK